jgi:hypothetical protein
MKRNGPRSLETVYSPISLRDLTLGVKDAIKEIESVDISAVKHTRKPLDDLDKLYYFRDMFKSMLDTICSQDPNMRHKKRSAPRTETPVTETPVAGTPVAGTPVAGSGAPKHVAFDGPLPKSKRNKRETSSNQRPKTPDQPAMPIDPNFSNLSRSSGESTALSGSSRESTDEEHTEMLLKAFLDNTLSIVRSEVRRLEWVGNEYEVEITKGYSFSIRSLISRYKGLSKIKLGWDSVGIKNDGGMAIKYTVGGVWTRFQPGCHMPVLSLEVFLFVVSC